MSISSKAKGADCICKWLVVKPFCLSTDFMYRLILIINTFQVLICRALFSRRLYGLNDFLYHVNGSGESGLKLGFPLDQNRLFILYSQLLEHNEVKGAEDTRLGWHDLIWLKTRDQYIKGLQGIHCVVKKTSIHYRITDDVCCKV